MLSYSEFAKTNVTVALSLSEWEFVCRLLRRNARMANELLRPQNEVMKYIDIADKIESITDKIINGGNK